MLGVTQSRIEPRDIHVYVIIMPSGSAMLALKFPSCLGGWDETGSPESQVVQRVVSR